MEDLRSYKLRGTPDCPIAMYPVRPGGNVIPYLHYHPEMEILFVFEGSVDCRLDKEILHLTAGDIVVIAPEQIHGHIRHSADSRFTRLIFSLDAIAMPAEHAFQKEFVQPLQNNLLQLPSLLQPGHPAYDDISKLSMDLKRCTINAPNWKLYRYSTIVALCACIAPWCIRLDEGMKDTLPGNKIVRKVMLYIHNMYDRDLDLKTIAKHAHLHPNYLCALFKEHTGQTVLQHLTRRRVEAATFLLQDGDLPIEVIAEKTGFRSQGLFFRHFREITGMTPKAYRRSKRQVFSDNEQLNGL